LAEAHEKAAIIKITDVSVAGFYKSDPNAQCHNIYVLQKVK
jgi:hypothetical protein